MNLADISIRRPTFITCIVLVMLAVGGMAISKLGVDLFPNVSIPVVFVSTPYPGAGPSEIEQLVSKPIEDEFSTLSGLKRLSSINQEGVSIVIAEFTMETDIKNAEQQARDRIGAAKRVMPRDIKEPVVRRFDPSDLPVVTVSIRADLPADKLYDTANEIIRPKLEQVNQVGMVEVLGGQKREIRVSLDRSKLKSRELSASLVATRLGAAGEDIPAGTVDESKNQTVFRTLGQFTSLDDIRSTIVSFFGNDVPTRIRDLGTVSDGLTDEKTRTFLNGNKALLLNVYRQSGANTIAVVDGLTKQINRLNEELKDAPGKPAITMIRDGSKWIRFNVDDVKESIIIGALLAVIVVFLFLGNGRSTIITGLALPNSLIGSFILMAAAGFTINVITLLALSLSVGLLIDDAIVVRENIFRHIEMGKKPTTAAREGTAEVRLAVIATTMTVIAVFGPVGFLGGVVGQFLKSFGLTICFAMAISLFDALTMAPMLSAYFAGVTEKRDVKNLWDRTIGKIVDGFGRFQDWLADKYENLLRFSMLRTKTVLGVTLIISVASCATIGKLPKAFQPAHDNGEFTVSLDLPPGTNLSAMTDFSKKVDEMIRKNPEIDFTSLTVGKTDGQSNVADIYVSMVPAKQRKANTNDMKEKIRSQLKPFAMANPKVKDFDPMGGGMRAFALNITGTNQKELERVGTELLEKFRKNPSLKDVDVNFRAGQPEFQVRPDKHRAEALGISSLMLGQELRAQVEGVTPAKFREAGLEYDIRVRLQDDQRNLRDGFSSTYVPNINNTLVRLSDVAKPISTDGPSKITRQDRIRYVQISADVAESAGLGNIMDDVKKMFKTEYKLPEGMSYRFIGQGENLNELFSSMGMAMGFGVLFIFLVLASLYESFVTPLTIMLALPLAMCGSFVALWLTGQSLNLFSIIGTILLLGVASKNSILLVDYAHKLIDDEGISRTEAIIRAGKIRLRPILMTTMALIAGTLPVALGLSEAARSRMSMGIATIGGLISSTVLTLIVVPIAFPYIDRFRVWSKAKASEIFAPKAPKKKTVTAAVNSELHVRISSPDQTLQ